MYSKTYFKRVLSFMNQWGRDLAHITKMLRRRIKTGIDEFDKHVI
jgi:hypothetical protein